MEDVNKITESIIGCAIEVHRQLGPGLLESTYESALCIELGDVGLRYQQQLIVPVVYKGRIIGEYRVDLMVEDSVIVEIKSVERFDPVFEAWSCSGLVLGLPLILYSDTVNGWIMRS